MNLMFCLATLALATASAQNAADNPAGDHRTLCMFFDLRSLNAQDLLRAQENAVIFIENKMTSNDAVAIMTYTTGLNVIQDFTSDRDSLIATLRKIAIEPDGNADTNQKLAAIENTVNILGALPAKKALLYFSGGDLATSSRDQLQVTINAAARANVSIYPIDARRLN